MSMKKTDLEKHLAKKLDGRLRMGLTPQRFGQGSEVVKDKAEQKAAQAAKLVPVSCRLPAELVAQLRERAVGFEGGMSALMAQAAEQWLAATAQATDAA
jgi:hypothetical protein